MLAMNQYDRRGPTALRQRTRYDPARRQARGQEWSVYDHIPKAGVEGHYTIFNQR
jgi:hypothetical protein